MERKKPTTRSKSFDGMGATRRPAAAASRRPVRPKTKTVAGPSTRPTIPSVPVGYIEPDPRVGALDLSQASTDVPRRPRRVAVNGGQPAVRRVAVAPAPARRVITGPAVAPQPAPRSRSGRAPIARPAVAERELVEEPQYDAPRRRPVASPSDELQDQFHLPEIHERVFEQPTRQRRGGKAGIIIVSLLVLTALAAAAVYLYLTYYQAS